MPFYGNLVLFLFIKLVVRDRICAKTNIQISCGFTIQTYFYKLVLINTYNRRYIVRKLDFWLCDNKGADQLRSNCEADHAFVFATLIVQFLFFLNPKFQASSLLL